MRKLVIKIFMKVKLNVIYFIVFFLSVYSCSTKSKKEKLNVKQQIDKMKSTPDSLLTKVQIINTEREYQVTKGEVIVDSILIINKGTKNLNVESIKSACDCTAIDFVPTSIKPLDSIIVKYSIKTADMQGGYNQRTINVIGNFFPFYKNINVIIYLDESNE
jgi:hypothetical protein